MNIGSISSAGSNYFSAIKTKGDDPGDTSYVVKKGDTLSGIAKANKTTVAEIKDWNNLKTDVIKPGQILIVGEPATTDKKVEVPVVVDDKLNVSTYTVEKGDTLWSIAKKFDVTVKQIYAWSELTSETIKPGQILTVSGSETPKDNNEQESSTEKKEITSEQVVVTEKNVKSTKLIVNKVEIDLADSEWIEYTLQSGDNLKKIAKKYNTYTDAIRKVNSGINEKNLKVGSVINVPTNVTTLVANEVMDKVYMNPEISYYTSEESQTDNTPDLTAIQTKCRYGIVACNFLPLGTKIKIDGLPGIFTVEDRMNKRYTGEKNVDIWVADKDYAIKMGRTTKAYLEVVGFDESITY